jgi:putative lipoic acid-binding regulatory protein
MTEEELENFKQKLIESTVFPSVYMYKFIVESSNRNIALVENLFGEEADIHIKESGNGKYTSITAKQVEVNADEIISVYKKALEIKGIMFL